MIEVDDNEGRYITAKCTGVKKWVKADEDRYWLGKDFSLPGLDVRIDLVDGRWEVLFITHRGTTTFVSRGKRPVKRTFKSLATAKFKGQLYAGDFAFLSRIDLKALEEHLAAHGRTRENMQKWMDADAEKMRAERRRLDLERES